MVHVDVIGDGARNVVLLHGCPTPPRHMERLGQALGASYRVFLVHHPGYGASPAPQRAYSMDEASAWLESALLERGVQEAALVGYSAGAYRALYLLARGRSRWTGLVSMAGFARIAPEQRAAYLQFSQALLQGGVDLTGALVDLILAPDLRTSSSELVREVASWMQATSAEALSRELLAYAEGEDLLPLLRENPIPSLALVGELDHNQPPARSEEIIEAMPNASLQILPGVGHALLLEDFPATLAAVEDFLGRLEERGYRDRNVS